MGFRLPWVNKKKENVQFEGTRDHNSEQENELLEIATHRFGIADSGKVGFDNEHLNRKWKRFDQIYRSQQWFEVIPDDKSAPVLNFTFAIIQSLVPRLTDNNPEVLLKPRTSPADVQLADYLKTVLDHLWYTNKMQEAKLPEVVIHALKYGTGLIKTIWDPDMWDGLGEVKYSVVHPMNFYPDPRAYDVPSMDYYFITMPKPLEYFIRRWPDKGHLVIPDMDWTDSEDLEGRARDTGEETATLMEYAFRDEEGNVCIMYYAGHVVLDIIGGKFDEDYDEDTGGNPIYRHNEFPITRVMDYPSEKEFWGTGEIELIATLQQLINSYEAQIIDNTRLMGNAQWLVNKTLSGLDESDAWIFDNAPGTTIFSHNGGVDRIPGVPIPQHIPDHLERLIFWVEQILGVYDVVQGRRPVGVRAASAIIALQEAANIRVREKAKHMGLAIRELSEQAISLVLENYEEPRLIRIAGEIVPTTLDVREALQERIVDMAEQSGLMQEMMPPELEQPEQIPQETMDQLMDEVKFPEFDVEVNVGPSIPQSQALLYEQAKEFYQLGVIDRTAVLEVTGFPNKEEILERMNAMEAQEMGGDGQERVGERTI